MSYIENTLCSDMIHDYLKNILYLQHKDHGYQNHLSSCRVGFLICFAIYVSSLIKRYCLVARLNNGSVMIRKRKGLNRYLCIYISLDNDKSPNSCLATVEAFIHFWVLSFILYPQRKLSRYNE